jgi:tetratricopeptide (TPR) repeat protein
MVPEFTVTVRPVTDKPELVQRRHFKNGEFTIDGLSHTKYQIQVVSSSYVGAKMDVEFAPRARTTNYRIVILHEPRGGSEADLEESPTASLDKPVNQQIPQTARNAYERGVELHQKGLLVEALVAYGEALRFCPNYLQALTDLAKIYILFDRPQAALAYLRRAQDIDGSNKTVRLNMAIALLNGGAYGDAIKMLQGVMREESRKSVPLYYIAKAQYLQRRFDIAEQTVRLALEDDPHLLDGWLLLVNLGLDKKDHAMAKEGLVHLRQTMNNGMFSKFVDEQLTGLVSDEEISKSSSLRSRPSASVPRDQ